MAELMNTVDIIGDDALTDAIILRNITEYRDYSITKIGNSAFWNCSSLSSVDLRSVTIIAGYAFHNCGALTALILRDTSKVCVLDNQSALRMESGAPLQKVYFYVPSALIDSYKSATNWSTFASKFRALEDYTVDGTTTGELDPNKI